MGQDILAADEDLCDIGIDGDGIAWIDHCEGLPQPMLRDLISRGADAGLPVLLTTTSARAGAGLTGLVNALVIHRMPDAGSADHFASHTGAQLIPEPWAGPPAVASPGRGAGSAPPAGPAGGAGKHAVTATKTAAAPVAPSFERKPRVSAARLQQLGRGEFALVTRQPGERLVAAARTVPVSIPEPRAGRTAAAVTPVPVTPAGVAEKTR